MNKLLTILTLFAANLTIGATSPNFVFILADDMGWTGTSIKVDPAIAQSGSDYYQTPNLEKLAAQSMIFARAYSPGPMCTPSRAAILTGKTPAELHMTAPGGGRTDPAHKVSTPRLVRELPEKEVIIAEQLKKKGYVTAYFGKWHMGTVSPSEHGFDVHDGVPGNEVPEPKDGPKDVFGLNKRAMKFIEAQAKAKKPFYVQLSHWAVHGPVESSEASQKKFEKLEPGKGHKDPAYAGMTFDLDASIGILLKKLDQLKLGDNTYVIFMSDNGAPSGARQGSPQNLPLRDGKSTVYEGGIRVPLIVRGPGIKAGTSSYVSVSGCDLYPTLSELAGIEMEHEVAGSSLVPLLMKKEGFKRENELLFHYPHYGRTPARKPQTAVIRGDYKLIKDNESGESELYDLEKDIGETTDLSEKLPEVKSQMVKLLDRRLKETKAQLNVPNPGYDPEAVFVARQGPNQAGGGRNANAQAGAGGRNAQGGPAAQNANAQGGRQGGRQGGGPAGPDEFMERFDKNKDGKVSKDEFDGPPNRWQRLDADGDGIVTKADVEANPGRR